MKNILFDDGNFSIKQHEKNGADFVSYVNAVTGNEFDISFDEAILFSKVVLRDNLQKIEDRLIEYKNKEYQTYELENKCTELQKEYENLLKDYRAVVKALIKQIETTDDYD